MTSFSLYIYKPATTATAPKRTPAMPEPTFAPAPVAGAIGADEPVGLAPHPVVPAVPAGALAAPAPEVGYTDAEAGLGPPPRPTEQVVVPAAVTVLVVR